MSLSRSLREATSRLRQGRGRADGAGAEKEAQAERAEEHDRRRALAEAGEGAPYLLAHAGGAIFCVNAGDRGVSRKLFVRQRIGVRPVIERAVEILATLGRSPRTGGVFVDVGAHIGTATVSALRFLGFDTAIAFEPEPHNHRMLQVNLLLNGLDTRATAVAAAVSDSDGKVPLLVLPDVHGGHKVVSRRKERRYAERDRMERLIEVDSLTLDTALARQGLTPTEVALAKIDAQGHEPEILVGASGLVAAGVPMLVEYWPDQLEKKGRLRRFEELVASGFTRVFDLGAAEDGNRLEAQDVGRLRDAYREKDKTDLLLVREP